MSAGKITLSGFADEISSDLQEQLDTLESLGIKHLELRGVWGRNVLSLSDGEAREIKGELDRRGFRVSAIGSPIGKIPVTDPFPAHLDQFKRALDLARLFGAPYLRLFSFFIPEGDAPAIYREEVVQRLRTMAEIAQGSGIMLLHENEKHIYGDTGERCRDLLAAVGSPLLRAVFDPANFVQCGVRPMDQAYPALRPYIEYIHVKDAVFADGAVRPAGRGDGQVRALLSALKSDGFAGFLSLEPHLAAAGTFAGYSGPELFREAALALKELLAELAWEWH